MAFWRFLAYIINTVRVQVFMRQELKLCRRYHEVWLSLTSPEVQMRRPIQSMAIHKEKSQKKRELERLAHWLELQDVLNRIATSETEK